MNGIAAALEMVSPMRPGDVSTDPNHNWRMDKLETLDAGAADRPSAVTTLDGAVALDHWGLIRASGSDAASFLHGQLTSGFNDLRGNELRLAGFCSAKGRLQASFFAWRSGPDEFLLACHRSVLAATLKRLSMFVMRSKCKLGDAGSDQLDAASRLRCSGLVGPSAERAHAAAGFDRQTAWQQTAIGGGYLLGLPASVGISRAVWVGPAGSSAPGAAGPAMSTDAAPALTLDHWRWLEVRSGIPMIEAETADQFVPQMVNFEIVGGVDFQKGCYPGQEVVARSQYRGTVKRRMFVFDAAGVCTPGQEVYHSSDAAQPAGLVVNAAPRATGSGDSALVEVKLALLDSGSLHLDSVDGPLLSQLDLPYAISAPGEA